MEKTIRACIINGYVGGGWYFKGQERLVKSLNYHGCPYDILTFSGYPTLEYGNYSPYCIKAAAFTEAIKRGYTHILWLDCSAWCINNIEPIFDIINHEGYYFLGNNHRCSEYTSEACYNHFGLTKNDVLDWTQCSSGIIGINLFNPKAKIFLDKWLESARCRAWHPEIDKSKDQGAASIIINQMGLKMYGEGIHAMYYKKEMNESVIIAFNGL